MACEDRAARPCDGASTAGEGRGIIGSWGWGCIPEFVRVRPIDGGRWDEAGTRAVRVRCGRCGRLEGSGEWSAGTRVLHSIVLMGMAAKYMCMHGNCYSALPL